MFCFLDVRELKHSDIDIHLEIPTLTERGVMNEQPTDYVKNAREKVAKLDDEFKARVKRKHRGFAAIGLLAVVVFTLAFFTKADAGQVYTLLYMGEVENCATKDIELQERGLLPPYDLGDPNRPYLICIEDEKEAE